MPPKQKFNNPFLLTATLIVLSFLVVVLMGILIYAGVFYTEVRHGLEIYLSDTFAKFPFPVIYALLVFAALFLLVSVVLMWMKKKTGLYLYFCWSFAILLLLLFAEQIDWFNMLMLLVLLFVLILNRAYFFATKAQTCLSARQKHQKGTKDF